MAYRPAHHQREVLGALLSHGVGHTCAISIRRPAAEMLRTSMRRARERAAQVQRGQTAESNGRTRGRRGRLLKAVRQPLIRPRERSGVD
jgi:hypothetical protein